MKPSSEGSPSSAVGIGKTSIFSFVGPFPASARTQRPDYTFLVEVRWRRGDIEQGDFTLNDAKTLGLPFARLMNPPLHAYWSRIKLAMKDPLIDGM